MKPTGKALRALIAAYRQGATVRDLAAQHNVHESTIRAWLGDTPRRDVGPRPLPVDTDEIVAMRDKGEPWEEIAQSVGMSKSGVRRRYMAATTGRKRWNDQAEGTT